MSTEIDKRIVQMEFVNQEFEKNAERTKKTLEELEKSLDFDNDVSKSLDIISSKFTTMGMIGQNVLRNLTDSVVDLGKTMVKSLTIDGLTEGFGQYESINSSTKVLMNATGDSLDTVTKYLKELQSYAQATVYDFAFMTENITKFVNSGLDLDVSVRAMEGLGNAMAYVGVEGAQANQVIYNTSQALSTGFMGLMDWKSLELAGMATKNFKQVLLDTAVEMGTVVKVGEKYQSLTTDLNGKVSALMDTETMRNELASRWLTNDVLIAALSKYTDESTELGKAAAAAARNITSFSKMIDALTEERSGGWASSFRIIFGDLEEATEMWTNIYTRIEKWMSSIAEFRNNVLTAWAGFGGRNESIQAFHNMLSIVEGLASPMGKALDKLFEYNKGWRYLDELTDTIDIGPVGNVLYESMVKASRGFNSFTESLIPSEKTLRSITDILTGVFTIVRDIVSVLTPVVIVIGKTIKIVTPLFKILLAIGGVLGNIILQISNAVREALNLGPAFNNITEFLDNIYNHVNTFSDMVVDKIYEIPDKISLFLQNFKFPDLRSVFTGMIEGFTNAVNNFKNKKTLSSFFEGLFATESVQSVLNNMKVFFSNAADTIKSFVSRMKESIRELGPIGELIVSVFDFVVDSVRSVIDTLKILSIDLSGVLSKISGRISEFLSNITFTEVMDIAKLAGFLIAMNRLRASFKSIIDIADDISEVLSTVKKSIKKIGDSISGIGKGIKMELQAEAFMRVAYGMGVIVASIIALSTVDPEALNNAVIQFVKIGAIMATIILAMSSIQTKSKRVRSVVDSLGESIQKMVSGLSVAAIIGSLTIFVGALSVLLVTLMTVITTLGRLDNATFEKGLDYLFRIVKTVSIVFATLFGSLAALMLIDKIPSKSKGSLLKVSGSLLLLAVGLNALIAPIAILGKINPKTYETGFAALTQMLAVITLFVGSVGFASMFSDSIAKNLASVSLVLVGLAASLTALIIPIFALGSMKPEVVARGLSALQSVILTMSIAIVGLATALHIIGKTGGSLIKLSLAFGVLAASFAAMSLIAPLIERNADGVKSAIIKLVDIAVDALVSSADKIAKGALELITAILVQISAYLPRILIQIEVILTEIIDWLIGYLPTITNQLGIIIAEIITGIGSIVRQSVDVKDFVVTLAAIYTIMTLIKRLAKLKDSLADAIPSFIILATIITALSALVTAMIKNGVYGSKALSISISMSILLRAISTALRQLPDRISAFKNVKIGPMLLALGAMSSIMVALSFFIKDMVKIEADPMSIIKYAIALAISLRAMAPVVKAFGKFPASTNPLKVSQVVGIIAEIASITAVLALALAALAETNIEPFKMIKYSVALSSVFIGISPMILSLAVVQKACSKMQTASLKPMLGVLAAVGGIALAIVGSLALLSLTDLNAFELSSSVAALSAAFWSVIPLITITGLLVALLGKLNIDAGTAVEVGLGISAAMGIIAIIIGGISALFGAIDLFTEGAFASEVAKGAEIIWSIGEAIGALIGGILGGIGGSTLSSFSNTAQPFFDAVSALPDNFGEKMQALAIGFLALSGAGFVQAITDLFGLFTGTSSLTKLGQELAGFGPYMSTFVESFPSISLWQATNIRLISESIKSLVDAVPKQGGVAQWFTGTSNMEMFANNIGTMGKGMWQFSLYTKNLDADSVEHAVYCGKMMAELANTLPKVGGIVQAWGGTVDMKGFSENLPELAKGIVKFNDTVTFEGNSVINEQSVNTAVNAGRLVAGLFNDLPETGGILQKLLGEKDLEKFANNLPILGEGVVGFNTAVTSEGKSVINEDAVNRAIWVGQEVAGIYNTLPANTWFATFPDLGGFATNIELLGQGIAAFSRETQSVNGGTLDIAIAAINSIAGTQDAITGGKSAWFWDVIADSNRMKDFANNLPKFGTGIKGLSDNMAGANIQNINSATEAIEAITNATVLANNLAGFSIEVFQRAIESIDTSSLTTKVTDLAATVNTSDIAKKFQFIGRSYIQNLYMGMRGDDAESKNALKASSENAINIIREVMLNTAIPSSLNSGPFYRIGEYIVRGVAEGMYDRAAINSVVQAAGNVVAEALDVMASVAQIESPSKRAIQMGRYTVEGYGIGLSDNIKMVTAPAKMISEEAIKAMNEGMMKVYALIDSGAEFKPTISPVIDLTNARKSAAELGTLFNSVDTASQFGANNDYSINLTRGVKMEVESSVKPTDLTSITDGISKLGQKLSDMERTIGDMQIYLDTGALVGSMTVPFMKSMGSQQRKMGRGVIPSRVI